MTKNIGLLARLFRRSESPIVSQLFTQAIGKPLLVHPQLGQQLIGAYLHGAVEARPSTVTFGEIAPGQPATDVQPEVQARRVGILNVSGALVNRYEGDWCDPGPLSYESLRSAFDSLLADPTVEAIVLRIESPGGMASGLFDLADHVFVSRGIKPIYAAIDDYAYSAAYGLAAAADEIWITRTGGAGSVGVRAFHVDQSEWNSKNGLVVTEIISGEHKADLSPHAPLSKEAHARLQAEIDSLRQLFAGSVARYRGMEVEDVLATEALTYMGEEAIAVGFADRLGTFTALMEEIAAGSDDQGDTDDAAAAADDQPAQSASQEPTPAAAVADQHPATAAPASSSLEANAARGMVAAAVVAANLAPAITAALLKRTATEASAQLTPDNVEAAIADARAIDDACAAAGLRDYAADYVASGAGVDAVRTKLAAAVADAGPEIVTTHPAPQPAAARGAMTKSQEIYSRRAAAAGRSN